MNGVLLGSIILISLFFFFEGFRRIIRFIFMLSDWVDSRNWLAVNGRIIESKVDSVEVQRYKRGGRMFPNVIRFLPNIRYEYQTNENLKFQSASVYLTQESLLSNFASANSLVEKYPLNKNVRVYCHPQRPQRSFLEKREWRFIMGNLVGGVIWLFLGAGFLIQELSK